MMGALWYLLVTSWQNRLLMRFRRLKQPKYLVGAVMGMLYFAYICSARFLFSAQRFGAYRGGVPSSSTEGLMFREMMGALIFFVVILLAWLIPHERAALIFTEAEVAFLFPAPVTRKTLVHFKLLKSQFGILFTSVLFSLVFGWSRASGPVWTRALGWWLILSILNLHFVGSSFARTMLMDRGISNWKRRLLVLGTVVVCAGVVAVWAWRTLPPPPPVNEVQGVREMKAYAEQVLFSGPLFWLLYPFRMVVRPYLAPDAHAFWTELAPALLLLALHYVWVARSDVAFEEASVEASRKVAERVAAIRAGKRRPLTGKKGKRVPFTLRPTGSPAIAFLWKNLIGARSGFTLRAWLILIWIGGVVGWSVARNAKTGGLAPMLGFIALIFLAMSFFLGTQLVREDFRQELPMADVLKTYPLPVWQIALGELLAPAAILTAVQWCLIVFATATMAEFGQSAIPLSLRLSIAFAAAILTPVLNMVALVIPNSAILLFPGWFQTGREAPQGIEATGQRVVFAFGQLAVLILSVVPASIAFAIVYYILARLGPALAIPPSAIVAALVLAVEAGFGVALVGKLFQRFDLSLESTPG